MILVTMCAGIVANASTVAVDTAISNSNQPLLITPLIKSVSLIERVFNREIHRYMITPNMFRIHKACWPDQTKSLTA